MRRVLLTLISIAMLAAPQIVSAHATPLLYSPPGDAPLASAPPAARIEFSERVEPGASSIRVFGPSGNDQKTGPSTVDPLDQYGLIVPVRDEGFGTYTASWHVISKDDGHYTTGAFIWTVGTSTTALPAYANASFQISHSSSLPEAATLFLELLGEALFVGCLIFSRDKRLIILGFILVGAGSGGYLFLKSTTLAAAESAPFYHGLALFLQTAAGRFTLYRGAAALIFTIVALTARETKRTKIALLATVSLVTFLRAEISHAAASAFLPSFGILVNTIHLLAKEAWIGCAAVLILTGSVADRVTRKKYARVTAVALAIGGVSGAYIVWLHLKDLDNLLTTEWGTRCALTLVTATFFLLLHLVTTLILERSRRNTLQQWIRSAYRLEALLGIVILFQSSLLIITTPPLPAHDTHLQSTTSQGVTLQLENDPWNDTNFRIVASPGNAIAQMTVTLENTAQGIGPIKVPVQKIFPGGYTFEIKLLNPRGSWNVHIIAAQKIRYDALASFDLDTTDSPTEAPSHSATLGLVSLAAALGILFLSFYLARPGEVLEHMPHEKHPFLTLFLGTVIICGVLPGVQEFVLTSKFEKLCTAQGFFWTQSVPLYRGIPGKAEAVTGCTVGMGRDVYHFGDISEYEYFLRKEPMTTIVSLDPAVPVAEQPVRITVKIKDADGNPERDLLLDHERIIHAIIVDESFATFAHIHPENVRAVTPRDQENGMYTLAYTFPHSGHYLLALTYLVRGNTLTHLEKIQVGSDTEKRVESGSTGPTAEVDGYTVSLKESALPVQTPKTLTFRITKNGEPVRDLTPYLGAAMHIAVVREDFSEFQHVHGEPYTWHITLPWAAPHVHVHTIVPEAFGPEIQGVVSLQNMGRYHIFAEFKDSRGVIHHAHFVRTAE